MKKSALILTALLFCCACSHSQESAPEGPRSERAPDAFRVNLDTTKGPVIVEVTRDWSPNGADRFYTLVKNGYYDGDRFFRVVPGFVTQFGLAAKPESTKKWDFKIPDDPVKQSNQRGMLVFATAGPNTRTTQLFINLADNARLDGMGFSPFGRVVSGMDAVDGINSEYGESPDQKRIETEGSAYLEKDFPRLDYIKSAKIAP